MMYILNEHRKLNENTVFGYGWPCLNWTVSSDASAQPIPIQASELAMSEEEVWKDIPGYEGYYQVSDHGRIRSVDRKLIRKNGVILSCKGRVLAPQIRSAGYRSIQLFKKCKFTQSLIHTLVLTVFVGPRPDGKEGCHNDGNPSNNRLDNLRWDTHKNNAKDAIRHGRTTVGESNARAKLRENDIRRIRIMRVGGAEQKDIALAFGVSQSAISAICLGKTWGSVQ